MSTADPPSTSGIAPWWRRLLLLGTLLTGISGSAMIGVTTWRAERQHLRADFDLRSARLAAAIEINLTDAIQPLSALALFLETQPVPSPGRFAALARKVEALAFPVSRLAWEPRVRHADRAAFEAEAQAAGFDGYRISRLLEDGSLVPAQPAEEYFPIRLEATRPGVPSAIGFDITSDPERRLVTQLARDLGSPVAFRPALRQAGLMHRPAYLIYWPLFDPGPTPATVEERRRRLTGYVTAAVALPDILAHGLRGVGPVDQPVLFLARNPLPTAEPEPVALLTPEGRLVMIPPGTAPETRAITQVEHGFTLLGQHWTVSMELPDHELVRSSLRVPLFLGAVGLVMTGGAIAAIAHLLRRADRERAQRRRVEALMTQLEATNQALFHLNRSLSEREKASAELARARARFLAAASHDLRQPLHALALFTSALARRVSDPVAVELVGNIRELGQSMQAMFGSLLDLSRLDSGQVKARIAAMETEPLARRLWSEYAHHAWAKGLRARIAGRFPPVATDPSLLESVLRNLLDNAVKYTEAGGLLLAGRRRNGRLLIEIWDTGRGIPTDRLDAIFVEFERLDAGTRMPGFGLGLPIVRQLCALIGAELSVCSRPGHGSRFSVSLPLANSPPRPPAPEEMDPAAARGRILLVDDDPAVLRALTMELSDLGYAVRAESQPAAALTAISGSEPFDLAILDIRMGERDDGWMLADAWGAARPGTPVILMTGSTDTATLQRVRDKGLPALFKPVPPDRMRRLIAALIPSGRTPAPPPA